MTDLINKVDDLIKNDVETIEKLLVKYGDILKHTLPEREYPYHAFIINYCVNVIEKNHDAETPDWKAWAVLMVFKLYQDQKLKKLGDIPKIISEFFEFKDKEYQKFCDDTISVSDYDRDRGFMYRFYWKKSGRFKGQ